MATQNILVTPSTSLILIKNLSQQRNVYLSTLNVPDFKITVRDTTGALSDTSPIVLSTIGGALFTDGSWQYFLNNPYGLVNLSLRNSTIWQVLHTSGQDPTNSAANVNTINISTIYIQTQNTNIKNVSTLLVQNLATPNPIEITGPFVITNLSSLGLLTIKSTLNVFGDVIQQGNLFVSGFTQFLSSMFVNTISSIPGSVYISSTATTLQSTFVGGKVIVGSTLMVNSTIQVSTIQVLRQINQDSVNVLENMNIGNAAFIQSNVAVGFSTIVEKDFFIQRDLSSLQGDFTTGTLLISSFALVNGNVSTSAFFQTLSNLRLQSTLHVDKSIHVSSSVEVYQTLFTSSFFTTSLSTLGSISTAGPLYAFSNISFADTVSSFYISTGSISVGKDLFIKSNISSLQGLTTFGTLDVLGSAIWYSMSGNGVDGIGVGTNVNIYDTVSGIRQTEFYNTVNTDTVGTFGLTQFRESIGVRNLFNLTGDLTIRGASELIQVPSTDSFAPSNLEIKASSPFIALQVSSLQASSIFSDIAWIRSTSFITQTIYASTILTDFTRVSTLQTETVRTDSFRIGVDDYVSSLTDTREFYMNIPSYFTQGFSSVAIQTDIVSADAFQGAFIGNGNNLSNISNPTAFLSTVKISVSSIIANNISTNILRTSPSNTYSEILLIQSSFISEYLLILAEGYGTGTLYTIQDALGSTVTKNYNSFVPITSTNMVINNFVYFNRDNLKVGINVSNPLYDLDISGSVYCENLVTSSLNDIYINDVGKIGLNTLFTSSLYVRDYFQYGNISYTGANATNGGGLVFQSLINDTLPANLSEEAFLITNLSTLLFLNSYGIVDNSLLSSIVIGATFINNPERNVLVGWTAEKTTTNADFEVYTNSNAVNGVSWKNGMRSTEIRVSTIDVTKALNTTLIQYPNLYIFGTSSPTVANSTNRIVAFTSSIIINDFFSVVQSPGTYIQGHNIGIKTSEPHYNLHVMGNAYFSSLYVNSVRPSSISFNFQTL